MTAPTPATWPPARLCPATSNLPTRMLPASWRTLCAAMQRRDAVGANRGRGGGGTSPEDFKAISAARFPCATCQGRTLPPGLELITQEEATEMARTTKRGTCELCGANSNVGTNHGSKACTNCTHIQSALSKRPQSVANAIRAMGKTEELLGHLIPAGGLAVKVTADLLQEISGIVEYKGEDPAELVAAVRKRVLTCASCDAEDVLHEIREIVGYSADMGDKGLADAVRALTAASGKDCTDEEIRLRDDLARACDMGQDYSHRWGSVAQGAIQTIAALENRRDDLIVKLAAAREENARLCTMINARHSESEQVTALRDDLSRSSEVIEQLRAELATAAVTMRTQGEKIDEWQNYAVQSESNVETLEAELRNREDAPAAPCASITCLLDIALRALRGECPDADQLATLIDAARRAA